MVGGCWTVYAPMARYILSGTSPWRRLAASILLLALRDAMRGDPGAVEWLRTSLIAELCYEACEITRDMVMGVIE